MNVQTLFLCLMAVFSVTLNLSANNPCNAIQYDFGHGLLDTVPCGNAANTSSNIHLHLNGPTDFELSQACGPILEAPFHSVSWFTFIIQGGGGSFEWQLIESGRDDVYYEIYYSNDPGGTNECTDLSFYRCGDDFVSWELLGVPNPQKPTRFYVALYSKVPREEVTVNLKFRKACGESCDNFNAFSVEIEDVPCPMEGDTILLQTRLFDEAGNLIESYDKYDFMWWSQNGRIIDSSSHQPLYHGSHNDLIIVQVTSEGGCPVYDSISIVFDTTPPTFLYCPTDITVAADSSCALTVYWELPRAEDPSGILQLLSTHQPGSRFDVGVHTVRITATDSCGNESAHSFQVTVSQGNCCNEHPEIHCPADTMLCPGSDIHEDLCGIASVSGCSEYIISFTDQVQNNMECEQIIQRKWLAVDKFNSTLRDSCIQTITLKDDQPPMLQNVPEDITIAAGHNCMASNIYWPAPTAIDHCGEAIVSVYPGPDYDFPIGITTVEVKAVDACGNAVSDHFQVTITQGNCCNEHPEIHCPADTILCPGSDIHQDLCGIASVSGCSEYIISFTDQVQNNMECEQIIQRKWLAVDKFNATLRDSCMQTITLKDDQPPMLQNVPGDITIAAGHNCMASNIYWPTPTAIDHCGEAIVSVYPGPDYDFPIGITTVEVKAVDACGNTVIEYFQVTITQGNCCKDLPVLTCPADTTLCPGSDIHQDLCGIANVSGCSEYIISFTDQVQNNMECERIIQRKWLAVDKFNSTLRDSCIQTITLVDKKAPVFMTCPTDIFLDDCNSVVTWDIPAVFDNCVVVSLHASHQPGSQFSYGTTIVSYTAEDACGNQSICSFKVIVTDKNEMKCPDDIQVHGGPDGAHINWDLPEFSTCCSCDYPGREIDGFYYMGAFKGHHYYCSKFAVLWNDAVAIAQSKGGQLAVIEDALENQFIANNMCCDYALIGLQDIHNENQFRWINNQALSYTNWYPYQPNDKYGSQDVVEIIRGDGRWNDAYTNCKKNFIMEMGCVEIKQISGPQNGSKLDCGTHKITYEAVDQCGNTDTCSFSVQVICQESSVTYCEAYGYNSQYMWIHNVQLGSGINNTSGNDWGYGDYTHLSTGINAGGYLPICVIPGFMNSAYHMYWKMWIDYNQDGDFEDYGELAGYGRCYQKLCGSIPIRPDAQPGATRMRIAMRYGRYPANSCCKYQYGEVEDYSLQILGNPAYTDNQVHIRNDDGLAVELVESLSSSGLSLPGDSYEQYLDLYGNEVVPEVGNSAFSIYPNPALNEFTLNFKGLKSESIRLEIFDIHGKLWKESEWGILGNGSQVQVNIQDLESGVYQVRIWIADYLYQVEKLVKP